jgi:hypothetical protein
MKEPPTHVQVTEGWIKERPLLTLLKFIKLLTYLFLQLFSQSLAGQIIFKDKNKFGT